MDGILWPCPIAKPHVHAEDAHTTPSELIELLKGAQMVSLDDIEFFSDHVDHGPFVGALKYESPKS